MRFFLKNSSYRCPSAFFIFTTLFAIALCTRIPFAIGYVLGDDGTYLRVAADFLNRGLTIVGPTGQTEYRLGFLVPFVLFLKLFNYSKLGLVFYSLISGALLIPLTVAMVARHTTWRSYAPWICSIILLTYPTLWVDSLILVNDLPTITWALISTALFLRAIDRQTRPDQWRAFFGIASSTALVFSYTTKITGVVVWASLLGAELFISRNADWKRIYFVIPFFIIPIALAQGFFSIKTGNFLGNYFGEQKLYEAWIPNEYWTGQLNISSLMASYPSVLFEQQGTSPFLASLHSLYPILSVIITPLVWLLFRFRLSARPFISDSRAAIIYLFFGMSLYLFLQYFPARLSPFYLPNAFPGRPWRYLDVLIPFIAATSACSLSAMLTQHKIIAFTAFLITAFAMWISGTSIVLRYYDLADRSSDLARAGATMRQVRTACSDKNIYLELDAIEHLRFVLNPTGHPPLFDYLTHTEDLRRDGGCVFTGGSRREAIPGGTALSDSALHAKFPDATLVLEWPAALTPWRFEVLRLWKIESEEAGQK